MRRLYVSILLAGFLSLGIAQAQQTKGDRPTREQIAQNKRNFLIKALELTADEANKIMPILNELDDKRFELWQKTRDLDQRVRDQDPKLTDAELIEYAELKLNNRVKEAELERTYYLRCRPHLRAKQFVKLEFSCHRFAREFFHQHPKHKR